MAIGFGLLDDQALVLNRRPMDAIRVAADRMHGRCGQQLLDICSINSAIARAERSRLDSRSNTKRIILLNTLASNIIG